MAVVYVQVEFFKAHRQQVHNITNVQVKDPVVLVLDPQNRFHVVLQLYITAFAFRQSALIFAFVNIVIGMMLSAHFAFEELFRCLFISYRVPLILLFLLCHHGA